MEEAEKSHEIDYFDPLFIAAFIMAGLSDFIFLFGILGLAIPIVGIVLLFGVIGIHLFAGLFMVPIMFKLKHFVPKLILGAAIILPLPVLVIGMVLAIVAQNRLVELVLTQAALAVTTAGVGNVAAGVAEGGNVVAKGAQAIGAGTKGLEAATGAAEGMGAATKGVEALESGVGVTQRGLRGKIENRLKKRVGDLEQELGIDEDGTTEEDFGITEPTDKMKELFEPNFSVEEQSGESSEAQDSRKVSHWTPEPTTGKEVYGRIDKEDAEATLPKKIAGVKHLEEVDINEDTNEVNLKKEA